MIRCNRCGGKCRSAVNPRTLCWFVTCQSCPHHVEGHGSQLKAVKAFLAPLRGLAKKAWERREQERLANTSVQVVDVTGTV